MISIEQKQELKEAFNEFDRDGSGFINTKVRNRHQSKKKHKINTKVRKKHKGFITKIIPTNRKLVLIVNMTNSPIVNMTNRETWLGNVSNVILTTIIIITIEITLTIIRSS